MGKFLRRGNSRIVAYMLCALMLFLLWHGTEYSLNKLQQLQAKSMRPIQTKVAKTDAKAFYPVLLKQSSVLRAESELQAKADLDSLFRTKKEEKELKTNLEPPKPIEPNYKDVVRQMVSTDGITNNGAIINGKFYKVGERMEELTVRRPNGMSIVPVLVAAAKDRLEIQVDKELLAVTIPSIVR